MSPDPRPPVSDQTSSPETWVCRASHVAYGYCTSPVGVLPGHGACGPAVPPAPTPEPEPAPLPDTGDGRPPLDWVCRRSVGSCTADAPHAGSMCGPEDVPSLDELRRGVTSEATCDRCGRQTWTEREVMRFCRMTQPSGDECAGTLRPAAPPAPTPEPRQADERTDTIEVRWTTHDMTDPDWGYHLRMGGLDAENVTVLPQPSPVSPEDGPLRHHPMTYRSPDGQPDNQPDWSYQRRIITEAIHAFGCLGWESADDQGPAYHRCRSVAGNVGAALHVWGQLVPDDFQRPSGAVS